MNKAERIRQNGSPIIGFNIRRLREQKRLWNMVAKLLSFPTHIHATHPNALFPAIFFMCNPILRELVSVGGIFFSRTALPNGVFWSRGLTKATRPLICTHLDPHLSPVYAFYFRLSGTPCQHDWGLFCQIITRANKEFRLPIRPH